MPLSASLSVFLLVSLSSTITSGGLLLSVSYDVLWPRSGSRTVTVLSLCHLIDMPLLVTCTHTMTINQVTDSTSPQPCAPASVSSVLHGGCTHFFGNATSHQCLTVVIFIFPLFNLTWSERRPFQSGGEKKVWND